MFNKNPFSEFRATQQQVQERTSAECNGMVCKNCGDTYGNPTEGSCMYDSKNPNGKNWMESKVTNEATLYVIPEDIKQIAHEVLRHRLILTFEAEADEINSDKVIDIILEKISSP